MSHFFRGKCELWRLLRERQLQLEDDSHGDSGPKWRLDATFSPRPVQFQPQQSTSGSFFDFDISQPRQQAFGMFGMQPIQFLQAPQQQQQRIDASFSPRPAQFHPQQQAFGMFQPQQQQSGMQQQQQQQPRQQQRHFPYTISIHLQHDGPIVIEKLRLTSHDSTFPPQVATLTLNVEYEQNGPTDWRRIMRVDLSTSLSPDDVDGASTTVAAAAQVIQFDVSYRESGARKSEYCPCAPCPDTLPLRSSLSSDLAKELGRAETADVHFVVGEETIPAHACILRARVPYFEALFSSGMRETETNRIRVEDADAESFSRMLKFVYAARLPEDLATTAPTILPIADKYDIPDLKRACEWTLKKNLEPGNVAETLILADIYGCPELKISCVKSLVKWKKSLAKDAFEPLKKYPDLLVEIVKILSAGDE